MKLKNKSGFKTYLRLMSSVRTYWHFILWALLGVIVYAAIDGILYSYLKPLIDKGFVERDETFLFWVPFFISGIFLTRGLASFLSTYAMGRVGRGVVRDFRRKMMLKLMQVPVSYFDEKTSGELVSKINFDTEQVAEAITDAVTGTIRGAFQAIALISVMLYQNWKITLIVMVAAPVLAVFVQLVSVRMRKHSTRIQTTMGNVTQVAEEVIEGYKVIRTYAGIPYESARIEVATDENRKQEMKMISTTAASVPAMQFIGAIALSALVILATLGPESAMGTAMTAGQFTAMFGAMLGLLRPIKQIAIMNSKLQRGIAGAESIFSLLDEDVEVDTGTVKIEQSQGALSFENVSFYYQKHTSGAPIHVLQDVSFTAEPGETVALVGRSGSGKSTLVSLLPRFYPLEHGTITLDGVDLRDIDLENLRSQFSIVSQQVVLFNDTIANNIAYGCRQQVSEEQIRLAAKKAYALDFIEQMPQGFDTVIGEQGARLSGGQRQRIAIARAILRDAPILILDEATSSLDTESERQIQLALDEFMAERTTLVIAHRLSTVEKADKIVVLDNGAVKEMGTHESLLQQKNIYARLYHAQFSLVEEQVVAE